MLLSTTLNLFVTDWEPLKVESQGASKAGDVPSLVEQRLDPGGIETAVPQPTPGLPASSGSARFQSSCEQRALSDLGLNPESAFACLFPGRTSGDTRLSFVLPKSVSKTSSEGSRVELTEHVRFEPARLPGGTRSFADFFAPRCEPGTLFPDVEPLLQVVSPRLPRRRGFKTIDDRSFGEDVVARNTRP
jgi:hypothetical protein